MEAMVKAVHDEKAKRRQHSAAYKQEILQDADACTKSGELGALLRREGLHFSLLVNWRKARAAGGTLPPDSSLRPLFNEIFSP
jgi:transposase-like protein